MECGGVFDVCYHEIPPLGCYTQRRRYPKQSSIRRQSILSGIVDAEPLHVRARNRYISKMDYINFQLLQSRYNIHSLTPFELKKKRLGIAQESTKCQDTNVPRI